MTPATQVNDAIQAIEPLETDALPMLRQRFDETKGQRKIHFAFGLAALGQMDVPFLVNAVADAPAGECDNFVCALKLDEASAIEELRKAASLATANRDWATKTRLATVLLYLGDSKIAADMLRGEPIGFAAEADPVAADGMEVSDEIRSAFVSAYGYIEGHSALCLDMPWEQFLSTKDLLRDLYYRPVRVRPFEYKETQHVAAVWVRDQAMIPWKLDTDLRQEDLPPNDDEHGATWIPADIAAYRGPDDETRYCILWSVPQKDGERRCVRANMTFVQWSIGPA